MQTEKHQEEKEEKEKEEEDESSNYIILTEQHECHLIESIVQLMYDYIKENYI